ncbi:Phosphoadenosine phosphosulfate reductase [Mesorhizobium metallidurans STM 2683]|uniref:Adenosine 5'-phosphosulfate reductase n=2 Tax=Mesorhizobium metallidurans TaxID=489722 RepID=M5F7Z4_9HYPH|nr:Phosphoadenosine phosphosulfate reductase [Mesorhizobium metallidurans STM 2683]
MYEAVIAELDHLDGPDLLAPLVTGRLCGNIALISSFGAESAVLLHMAASIDRSLPVITLDTGKLFAEAIAYRAQLTALLGLTDVRVVRPDADALRALDAAGSLHRRDPDRCCHIRKVLPLEEALSGFKAWISGRKRYHGGLRTDVSTLEEDDGRLKADPLARFTHLEIEAYLDHHRLPRHPLIEKGYFSIGCAPCTVAGGSTDNPRAGRWSGLSKMECGIHRSPAPSCNSARPASDFR